MTKPLLVTMGDAAGIGPEIIVRSLADPVVTGWCVPLVLGDARVLERAMEATGVRVPVRLIARAAEAEGRTGMIELVDYRNVDVAAAAAMPASEAPAGRLPATLLR